jgi:hypothetical protein
MAGKGGPRRCVLHVHGPGKAWATMVAAIAI